MGSCLQANFAEVFAGRDLAEIEGKFVAAGYDPATGAFKAGSVLAQGTTRDIIEVWWPGLDPSGIAQKMQLLNVDYRDLGLKHLKPLLPLRPVLEELHQMGLNSALPRMTPPHRQRCIWAPSMRLSSSTSFSVPTA